MAEQAVETVVERLFARKIVQVIADVVPGHDETGDLLDRENQLELFRWREGHITASESPSASGAGSTRATTRSRCSARSRTTR